MHGSIKDIMPYSNRNHLFKDKYFKLEEEGVCKTITSHMKMDCNMYIHPNQPRGLSPREASRIQTFPDDFIFMGANKLVRTNRKCSSCKTVEILGRQIIKYLR